MIRNFLLAACAAVTTFGTAQAQVGIGFRAGLAISGASEAQVAERSYEPFEGFSVRTTNSYSTGFIVGLPVELQVGPSFALQTELNLLRRSFKQELFTIADTDILPGVKVSYTALDVPVLAKFGKLSRGVTVAGVIGPSFQYIVGARERFDDGSSKMSNELKLGEPEGERIERLGIFGIAGIEVGLPLPFAYVTLDARYRQQLNDTDIRTAVVERGRVFSLAAGLRVPVGLLRQVF